jgi:cobalt-zinc-cadmium efflux system membrane fusion protein
MRGVVAALALALSSCGSGSVPTEKSEAPAEKAASEDGSVTLTQQQIQTAGIELVRPTVGGSGGAIALPGQIESDPDATRVVAAPLGGRIVALTRNLGDFVRRGETLAIIESREAAALHGEVERAQTRLALARATKNRDEALFKRGFRPLREVEISRAAFAEAATNVRMAQQQVAASGVRGGSLNRIAITAPIAGRIVARRAMLGQVFTADSTETEMFRVADTSRLSVTVSLTPADAARVAPGTLLQITAPGRHATARVSFVSPALDPQTRLVPAIARLRNPGGEWRTGEPVSVSIELPGGQGGAIRIPSSAVQTVEGRNVVFVRTDKGFRATPVTLGAQDGDAVIVTAGLSAREQIAAANSFTLKSMLGASADED